MIAQHLRQRREPRFLRGLRLLRFERGRLMQMRADVHADRADQQTEQERNAPAPGIDLFGRQAVGDDRAHGGAEDERDALARLLPAGEVAAALVRRVLDQEGRGTADFAAGREALDQPRDHDQDRCADANLRIRRRQSDDGRANRHQHDGERERSLAAHAVGVDAEHDGADRAHEEPYAERGDRQHERGEVVAGGEEQLGDDDRKKAVDREVEPLEAVADGGGDDGFASGGCGDGRGRCTIALGGRYRGFGGLHGCVLQCFMGIACPDLSPARAAKRSW